MWATTPTSAPTLARPSTAATVTETRGGRSTAPSSPEATRLNTQVAMSTDSDAWIQALPA